MNGQAGKGDKMRKGANHRAYWNNFPLEEKNTVSYWGNKLGYDVSLYKLLKEIKAGERITESEFIRRVENSKVQDQPATQQEIDEFNDCMNSISYSELAKIFNRK